MNSDKAWTVIEALLYVVSVVVVTITYYIDNQPEDMIPITIFFMLGSLLPVIIKRLKTLKNKAGLE